MNSNDIFRKISPLKTSEAKIGYLNEILYRQGTLKEETIASVYETLHQLYRTASYVEIEAVTKVVNAAVTKTAITDQKARSEYRQQFAPKWPNREYDPSRRRFSREIAKVVEPVKREEARQEAEKEELQGNWYNAALSWEDVDWERAARNYDKTGEDDFEAACCREKAGKQVDWEQVASACIQKAQEYISAALYDSDAATEATSQLGQALSAFELAGIDENDGKVREVYSMLFELGEETEVDAWWWAKISTRSGRVPKRDAFLHAAHKYEDELSHETSMPEPVPEEGESLDEFRARIGMEEVIRVAVARKEEHESRVRYKMYMTARCYKEAGELEKAAELFEKAVWGREALKARRLLIRQKNQQDRGL